MGNIIFNPNCYQTMCCMICIVNYKNSRFWIMWNFNLNLTRHIYIYIIYMFIYIFLIHMLIFDSLGKWQFRHIFLGESMFLNNDQNTKAIIMATSLNDENKKLPLSIIFDVHSMCIRRVAKYFRQNNAYLGLWRLLIIQWMHV